MWRIQLNAVRKLHKNEGECEKKTRADAVTVKRKETDVRREQDIWYSI